LFFVSAQLQSGVVVKSKRLQGAEVAMSPKELQKFKEAAEKLNREHDTPEKARELLIKIGYLDPDGKVAEKYR
jgi:hypothetical protein